MNAHRTARSALLMLTLAAPAAAADDLDPPPAHATVQEAVRPGMTVWITDARGREQRMRILDVSGDVVITTAGGDVRPLRAGDVVRVRARRADSVIDGALIGAGAGIAAGLSLCRLTEPWETCRDDVGPMMRVGALGAGIGIAIDALIRGRTTIYEALPGAPRVQARAIVSAGRAGLQLSLIY